MPEDDNKPYFDTAGAEAALRELDLQNDDSVEEVVEQAEPPVTDESTPDETTETETTEETPEAEEEDFIPRADLETLLEGLEGDARDRVIDAYKSFQRSATKSNQANAELRRAFDGIDPDEARQAFDFVQKLGSDPEYAMQVHTELTTALTNAGMSPRAAAQEASRQIEEKVEDVREDALADYEDNPFVQELNALKRWKSEQDALQAQAAERAQQAEFEAHQNRIIADIERQDAELRRKHPELEDEDMDAVYKVAAAMQGNLADAFDYLSGYQDRIVTNYVAKKKSVPSGGGGGAPVNSETHSEEPVEITSTKQAHPLAIERARHLLGL